MSAQRNDVWQVMVGGELYETDLETLKQWVREGAVQPSDKVNRANRRWIDAGLSPALRSTFYGDPNAPQQSQQQEPQHQSQQSPEPPPQSLAEPPPLVSWNAREVAAQAALNGEAQNNYAAVSGVQWAQPSHFPPTENAYDVYSTPDISQGDYTMAAQHYAATSSSIPAVGNVCHNHPQAPPKYICRVCCATFCAECPKFIGAGRIAMCTLCGDMCKPYEEFKQRTARRSYQTSSLSITDFGRALQYPFKHILALLFGAGLYAFLLLAGWRGQILACAVLFGCISHTINQVATGKLDRSFLPEFGLFNFYEDVIRPFFLSIAIIIVTWGPAIVLFLALLFGWLGSSGSESKTLMDKQREAQQQQIREDLAAVSDDTADEQKQQEALERLDPRARQYRNPNASPSTAQNQPKEKEDDSLLGLLNFANLTGVVLLLLVLSLVWAFFYYPMALAIAGYTEDVTAVVNPMVGLDTIKRMGVIYWKAFGMYFVVQTFALIVTSITNLILSPFNMPFIGNLPATFVNGTITFYTSLVIAYVLGLALFKRADELDIPTD